MSVIRFTEDINKDVYEVVNGINIQKNDTVVIDAVMRLKGMENYSDFGGVELLKYLLMCGYDNIYVVLSVITTIELIKIKTNALIVLAPNIIFINIDNNTFITNEEILEKVRAYGEKRNKVDYGVYFMLDYYMPQNLRHQYANLWGIRQMSLVYQHIKENNALTKYIDKSKVRDVNFLRAIYLYGKNWPFQVSKQETKRCIEIESQIPKGTRILQIDDKWHIGWGEVFWRIISGDAREIKKRECEEYCDLSNTYRCVKVFEEKSIVEQIEGFMPQVIILDLRLMDDDEDKNSLDVESISGVQILKKIREKNIGVPVVITTASNKVWTYEVLIKHGADCIWIKEGMDEMRNMEHTLNNYIMFIECIKKVCSSEYRRLNKFAKIISEIESTESPWWTNVEWVNADEKIRYTKVSKKRVLNILYEVLRMYRLFIQMKIMGYDFYYIGNRNNEDFKIKYWMGAIMQRMGFVIEAIHGVNKEWMAKDLMPRTCCNKNQKSYRGRCDVDGYELYRTRNAASHNYDIEQINERRMFEYMEKMIRYLSTKPLCVK